MREWQEDDWPGVPVIEIPMRIPMPEIPMIEIIVCYKKCVKTH